MRDCSSTNLTWWADLEGLFLALLLGKRFGRGGVQRAGLLFKAAFSSARIRFDLINSETCDEYETHFSRRFF
jgi:hypothetical protein